MYQALYRAERPEVFENVLGQEHIIKILKNQLRQGTVSHAYLFCGTRGTGKTTIARLLAKGLNCECEDTEKRPCGQCSSCRAISKGTFLDVIEIDAASNSGVENIRDLRESVKYPPVVGKHKVYIIDEVHTLSASAYNALLKTLEEPPEYVVFILATTEMQKLPQTILSRCLRLDFKRVPQSLLMEDMKRICADRGVEIEDGALKILGNCADGSVRDGLSVLDQVLAAGDKVITRAKVLEYIGSEGEDFFIRLTDMVSRRRTADALVLLGQALSDGKDAKQLMRDWLAHYRNLLLTKFLRKAEDVLNMSTENLDKVRHQSEQLSLDEINNAIVKISKTLNDSRYTNQSRILFEMTVVDIATDLLDLNVQRSAAVRNSARSTGEDVQTEASEQEDFSQKTAETVPEGARDAEPRDMKDVSTSENDTAESDMTEGERVLDTDSVEYDLDQLWNDLCSVSKSAIPPMRGIRDRGRIMKIENDSVFVGLSDSMWVGLLEEYHGDLEDIIAKLCGRSFGLILREASGEELTAARSSNVRVAAERKGAEDCSDAETGEGSNGDKGRAADLQDDEGAMSEAVGAQTKKLDDSLPVGGDAQVSNDAQASGEVQEDSDLHEVGSTQAAGDAPNIGGNSAVEPFKIDTSNSSDAPNIGENSDDEDEKRRLEAMARDLLGIDLDVE